MGAVLKQVIFFRNIMHKVITSGELFVKNVLILQHYFGKIRINFRKCSAGNLRTHNPRYDRRSQVQKHSERDL